MAEQERLDDAETELLAGYELLSAQLGRESPNTVLAIESLAEFYRPAGLNAASVYRCVTTIGRVSPPFGS